MAKVKKPAKKGTKKAAVDRELARYRSMRDFKATAEPSGAERRSASKTRKKTEAAGLPFVIQKHAAPRLHYDSGWAGMEF